MIFCNYFVGCHFNNMRSRNKIFPIYIRSNNNPTSFIPPIEAENKATLLKKEKSNISINMAVSQKTPLFKFRIDSHFEQTAATVDFRSYFKNLLLNSFFLSI